MASDKNLLPPWLKDETLEPWLENHIASCVANGTATPEDARRLLEQLAVGTRQLHRAIAHPIHSQRRVGEREASAEVDLFRHSFLLSLGQMMLHSDFAIPAGRYRR